jgi:hypothetical protein
MVLTRGFAQRQPEPIHNEVPVVSAFGACGGTSSLI